MNEKEKKRGRNSSNYSTNPFYNLIWDFLKKKRGKSYTIREVSRALGVKKPTYHLFREAMNELMKSGKIIRLLLWFLLY